MLIWLIIIFCIVIFGVLGYFKGLIRSIVSLIGLIIALLLAVPLGPKFYPLVNKLGFTHPFSPPILGPIFVYLLITIIAIVIAFLIDWQINRRYRFAMDEYTRLLWNRLSQRLGACIGIIAGVIYGIVICLLIYIFGYPAVLFVEDFHPSWQKLLKQARIELSTTGLDQCVAAFDPMPPQYYSIVEVLALIYHNNPDIYERLINYPAFLEFEDISEFQQIATDTQILGALQTKADIFSLIKHPKIIAILNNHQIMNRLAQIDMTDLYMFLKSGRSAKFSNQPILGRWKIDIPASYVAIRRKQPDMEVRQMFMIKLILTTFLPKLEFVAMPDGLAKFKLQLTEEAEAFRKSIVEAIRKQEEAIQQAINPYGRYSADVIGRYGFGGEEETRPQTKIPLVPQVPGMERFEFSGQGTWREDRPGRYILNIKDQGGNQIRAVAEKVDLTTLRIGFGNWVLVFYHVLPPPEE